MLLKLSCTILFYYSILGASQHVHGFGIRRGISYDLPYDQNKVILEKFGFQAQIIIF